MACAALCNPYFVCRGFPVHTLFSAAYRAHWLPAIRYLSNTPRHYIDHHRAVRVAVARKSPDATESESRLAANLELPIIEFHDPDSASDFDYLFVFDGPKLTLLATNAAAGGELCVDFSEAKLNYRAKSSIKDQSIARAVGVKGGKRPSVLDATAGLGKDAFLLASFGCSVSLLERSALIHALLEDGLERQRLLRGRDGGNPVQDGPGSR